MANVLGNLVKTTIGIGTELAQKANNSANTATGTTAEVRKTVAETATNLGLFDNLSNASGGKNKTQADAAANLAIDYATGILVKEGTKGADGNYTVSKDKWLSKDTRITALGGTKADAEAVFDAADLDGDGNLDAMELIALGLYKDATNGTADGKINIAGGISLDGSINVEGKKDAGCASNLMSLKEETGEKALRQIAGMAFGAGAQIKEVVYQTRKGLESDDSFQGDAGKVAEDLEAYLNSTFKNKDTNHDGVISEDEYLHDSRAWNFMGYEWKDEYKNYTLDQLKNTEGGKALSQAFSIFNFDTNATANGVQGLDINELAAQYIYRGIETQGGKTIFNGNNIRGTELPNKQGWTGKQRMLEIMASPTAAQGDLSAIAQGYHFVTLDTTTSKYQGLDKFQSSALIAGENNLPPAATRTVAPEGNPFVNTTVVPLATTGTVTAGKLDLEVPGQGRQLLADGSGQGTYEGKGLGGIPMHEFVNMDMNPQEGVNYYDSTTGINQQFVNFIANWNATKPGQEQFAIYYDPANGTKTYSILRPGETVPETFTVQLPASARTAANGVATDASGNFSLDAFLNNVPKSGNKTDVENYIQTNAQALFDWCKANGKDYTKIIEIAYQKAGINGGTQTESFDESKVMTYPVWRSKNMDKAPADYAEYLMQYPGMTNEAFGRLVVSAGEAFAQEAAA